MAARKTQAAKKTTRKVSASKPAAKKATAKAVAKKTTARKAAAVKSVKAVKKPVKKVSSISAKKKSPAKLSLVKPASISVGNKAFTKGQLLSTISEQTGVARKEVELVMSSMAHIIHAHLKKQGPESFTWPGILKILVVKKPATAAKWGTNPFTGEPMQYKAKPASRKIKIRALKGLKAMAL